MPRTAAERLASRERTIACGLAAVAARTGRYPVRALGGLAPPRAREWLDTVNGQHDAATRRRSRDATFVVEAIVEDHEAKAALFGELAEHLARRRRARHDDVLAAGRRSWRAASGHPERFVGLHVFNPVPKMELIELAFPAAATADTRARPRAVRRARQDRGRGAGHAGFVVNRLLFPFLFDAVG